LREKWLPSFLLIFPHNILLGGNGRYGKRSHTLVGKIETMKRFPSADNLDRIAEALKIAPADLLADTAHSKALRSKVVQQKHKSLLKMKILRAIDEAF
jgi:transcriptional regulator with XRE-family HTH domain